MSICTNSAIEAEVLNSATVMVAISFLYVLVHVTHGALVAHWQLFVPPCCRTRYHRSMGGWMIFHFFDCSSPLSFLLIEFHCTFSISYKIQLLCSLLLYIFWLGNDRPSGLVFSCPLDFPLHASLLTFFVCFFILFYSYCSHVWVFGKTIGQCMSSPFPVAILNGSLFLQAVTYSLHWPKLHLSKAKHTTTLNCITFVPFSVLLWNNLSDPVFDGVGLAGFKSRANAFLLA